eukprot:evm.model.scf_1250.6 EVM.evm.TU.scf_1250.6   scf_1250:26738-27716(-)
MLWTRYDCDSPPSPRYGHTAVALDARSLWGTELVVIFGGSSKQEGGRRALGDVVVFQVDSGSWFRPELRSAATPGSRAFHCAVGVGMRMFVFGGHVAVPDAEQQSFVRTYFNDMWYLSAVRGSTWAGLPGEGVGMQRLSSPLAMGHSTAAAVL